MQDPENYEAHKSKAARDTEVFVPRLISDMKWKRNENIMDYGCGAGSTGAKFLSPQGTSFNSKLYSVDVSEKMIEYAKRNYPSPSTTYALGNILSEKFAFQHIKFDKIFAILVLHFVKEYKQALKLFFECLKPGGQVGCLTITRSCGLEIYHMLEESEKWMKYMQGYESLVPDWVKNQENAEVIFKNVLEDIGFETVKLSSHTQYYSYENIEILIEFFCSLYPFIQNVPQNLLSNLKSDIRDFLEQKWGLHANSPSIDINYDLLYFVVRKP